jgi:D-glycero-alpha-D-manno-heptose-7-phosphate kinase
MIICQTPLRVSFFGGGTDFPEYFNECGGAVMATSIDKYIYHSVTAFPSRLFDYNIRLAYRRVECVANVSEIDHAPFRETLRSLGIERDIEISLAADLPSFSGLGSSSSFTVGLLNALTAFQGNSISKQNLAYEAIRLERRVLRENVGCQDQMMAAFGGLNILHFHREDDIRVHRIAISAERLKALDESLLLFFSGVTRNAPEIEKVKLRDLDLIRPTLDNIMRLVDRAHHLLTGNSPLSGFGELLHETWMEKRRLARSVSNEKIDNIYAAGMQAGALGGKLLGAGGGGFVLFFVPPERQAAMRERMAQYAEVPFHINAHGSRIIHS